MKGAARGCAIAGFGLGLAAIVIVGWVLLNTGACAYELEDERASPTQRYVAEIYSADCGLGGYRRLLVLRNAFTPRLPNLEGRPSGTVISRDLRARDSAAWEGEAVLVVTHGARAPRLERAEWGGVRIVTRRAP